MTLVSCKDIQKIEPGTCPRRPGLERFALSRPVSAGESIVVQLSMKHMIKRSDEWGGERWTVTLTNQASEQVAEYELLTINAYTHT